MNLFRTLAITVLFTTATSYADAPAKADSGPSAADVQKWLVFWDKLVDVVVANQDDCGKETVAINAHIDANKDLLDKATAAVKAGKQLPKDAQDHMHASMGKLQPAFQKCGKDDKFNAAFARLNMKH